VSEQYIDSIKHGAMIKVINFNILLLYHSLKWSWRKFYRSV